MQWFLSNLAISPYLQKFYIRLKFRKAVTYIYFGSQKSSLKNYQEMMLLHTLIANDCLHLNKEKQVTQKIYNLGQLSNS